MLETICNKKFDGIYFSVDEMMKILEKLPQTEKKISFLIVTSNEPEEVVNVAKSRGLDRIHVTGQIPFEQLSEYISCADAGLLVLPEHPSQKYRCPIKTANYLACGTPIIVNHCVGDEPRTIEAHGVGWVIDTAHPTIDWSNLPSRESCVQAVKKERNLDDVVDYLYRSLND